MHFRASKIMEYAYEQDNGATSLVSSPDEAAILIFSRSTIANPTEIKVYERSRPNQIKVHYGWVHASIGAGGLKGCEGYGMACLASAEEDVSEEVVYQGKVGIRQKRGEVREKRKAEAPITGTNGTKMKMEGVKVKNKGYSEGADTIVTSRDSKVKTLEV